MKKVIKDTDQLPSESVLRSWTVSDVTNWLHQVYLSDCVSAFEEYQINGSRLANLKEKDLRTMPEIPRGKHKEIMSFVKKIPSGKRFFGKKKADEPPVPHPPDYVNDMSEVQPGDDYDEFDESDEWDDDDYVNGQPEYVNNHLENGWNRQEQINGYEDEGLYEQEVAQDDDDDHDPGDYLDPSDSAFNAPMEPPAGNAPTPRVPNRPLPELPPSNSPPPPGLFPRSVGAGANKITPKRSTNRVIPEPPPKDFPPAPTKTVPPPAPVKATPPVTKPKPVTPAVASPIDSVRTKPAPPSKPGNIFKLTQQFEKAQAADKKPPPPAKPKVGGFLHSSGVPQAERMASNTNRPGVPRATPPRLHQEEEEDEDTDPDDYQVVEGEQGVNGNNINPAADRTTGQSNIIGKGGVKIFRGMEKLDTQAIRKVNLRPTGQQIESDMRSKNTKNARKMSEGMIGVSPMLPVGGRKASDGNILSGKRPAFLVQTSRESAGSSDSGDSGSGVVMSKAQRVRPLPPTPSQERPPVTPPVIGGPGGRRGPLPAPPTDPSNRPPVAIPTTAKSDISKRPLPAPPKHEEEETIYSFAWYFGDMERKEAQTRVTTYGQSGGFLVRKSSRGSQTEPYTLMFYDGEKVHSLHIRRRADNKYALGTEKKDELAFRKVQELIDYHRENPVALTDGRKTILTTWPSKR